VQGCVAPRVCKIYVRAMFLNQVLECGQKLAGYISYTKSA